MPVSDEYLQIVMEHLEPIGDVKSRSMFGGYGIFHQGLMFALISEDVLYFKVDKTNLADYENAGSQKFPHGISYWEVPADVLEDADALMKWAGKSIKIAIDADLNKTTPIATIKYMQSDTSRQKEY